MQPTPHSPENFDLLLNRVDELLSRLRRVEDSLEVLLSQRTIKDWYSTDELAAILGKTAFTVREWCRHGRIHAEKRRAGRGRTLEWIISHEELQRIRNHGLLPLSSLRRAL